MSTRSFAPFLLLLASALLFFFTEEEKVVQDVAPEVFSFEKHELTKVELARPEGDLITLEERDGVWRIKGVDLPANKTMINRIKHQLHRLDVRATVLPPGAHEDLERYGIGSEGVNVRLWTNGDLEPVISFVAGDPNPTNVSHYIQLADGAVYTVKKSALDYCSHPFDAFREDHFVSVDSKLLRRLEIKTSKSQRTFVKNESGWLYEDAEVLVDTDRIRRMVGRVSALKAQYYLDPEEQSEGYGLDEPQLYVRVEQEGKPPFELRMGKQYDERLAYFSMSGDPVVYVARSALLEDFGLSIDELRLRRPFSFTAEDVQWAELEQVSVSDRMHVRIKQKGGAWYWDDGLPISGSTPERLIMGAAHLRAVEFIASATPLENPEYRLSIFDGTKEHLLLLGGKVVGRDEESKARDLRHIELGSSAHFEDAFLAEPQLHRMCGELFREGARHLEEQSSKAARRQELTEER